MCEREEERPGKWLPREEKVLRSLQSAPTKGPRVKSSETEKIGLIKDLNDP
jgi:hypothetical protein